MNRVFPLQQFPLRERTSMYALMSVYFVVWISMMFASANMALGVTTGIRFVLEASFVLAVAVGTVQMKALARTREVIGALPMPNALWRTWVRACIVETSLAWAFLGVGMSVLLASRGSNMPWSGAFALLSSGLCIGAICVLAQYSMAPKKLGWLANAIAVTLLLAALYFGTGRVLAWFVNLPVPMLALLALSWPLLAGVLALQWRRILGAYPGSPAASRRKWLAPVGNRIRRYSPLDPTWARQPHAQQSAVRSRPTWLAKHAFYWFLCFGWLTPLRWQQEPDARHLLSLGLLCLIMTHTLVARDLHWRWLLMPGGWRAERIASDIFASTVKIYYSVIAVAVLMGMLFARLFKGTPGPVLIETVASYVLVLAEIAFAVSIGLVIRALPRFRAVVVFAAIAIMGVWIYVLAMVGYAALGHAPAAGILYAAAMVGAAYVLVRVADHMWTNEKLMTCARGAT